MSKKLTFSLVLGQGAHNSNDRPSCLTVFRIATVREETNLKIGLTEGCSIGLERVIEQVREYPQIGPNDRVKGSQV